MEKTIEIKITGKVQGVFFRQSTREIAQQLNITGEVRNAEDGSVHIIATGPAQQLDQLIKWSQQGPPRAKVENVETTDQPLKKFDQFRIVR